MLPLTFRKSLAFLMGFGVAILPSYGPFLGLLFFLGTRWSLRRADVLWLAAALIAALSFGLHQGLQGALFGGLQVLAPWLVYKAFREIRFGRLMFSRSNQIALGLLSGLFVVVALSWLQIEALNFSYAKTVAHAIVWDSHPSLYGHTILVLGTLIAILFNDSRYRMASLGLAALGILMTGSREAAIAWVVVAVALMLIRYKRTQRAHLMEIGLVALMLAVSVGLGPALGWGRVGFLVDLMPAADGTPNLVQGSELPVGDWWDPMGVQVEAGPVTIGGETLTAYEVTKVMPEPWVRLQQVLPLQANAPYTLSIWLKEDAAAHSGIQGWGQAARDEAPWVVTAALMGGAWQVGSSGPGQVLGSGVLERSGDWLRVWLAFRYEGAQPTLYWHVGMAPDQHSGSGSSAAFAGFQVEQGSAPSDYRPGSATRGLGLGVARLPYWRAAWQDFLERPLIGWGPGSFPLHYEQAWAQQGRMHDTPAHAHHLFLDTLFERGLIGFGALLLFLAAITQAAWRKRDLALLAVFAAVLIANLFDVTLFYSGVIYPLAAVAGWRAATYRHPASSQSDLSRQMVVGMVLPITDYAASALAFVVAVLGYNALSGLLGGVDRLSLAELWGMAGYALLLWPAMFWREGLYPGYGLSPQQQLKKQVSGAFYAGLLLAAGTVFFTELAALPRGVLVLTMLSSMGFAPFGRHLAKRVLHHAGLWGQNVVILGAGHTGGRIAKALLSRPLEGLLPVAFFDDSPALQGQALQGLPVEGKLSEASSFAERMGLRHAIVAIPKVSPQVLNDLIGKKGRAFRQVQFVPDLAGLPSADVYASSLDEMLALEVRNGLHSERNRFFKRVLDLIGCIFATFVFLPLLALLYLWIRLDSRGPAFYRSERLGQDGKVFYCLKFRSMYVDAEARLVDLLEHDPILRAEYEAFHKLENDPRITRAGRILRKYSLDELPQLWNVWLGEMSLVGPRPYLVRELDDMAGYSETILEAKPGMTGYWQVSGRNAFTFQERLEMEARYARNWSIWWDILILVKTVVVVLSRRGAK